MGELAIPPPIERKARQVDAASICQSVVDDVRMPLPDNIRHTLLLMTRQLLVPIDALEANKAVIELESFIFSLADEVTRLRAELEEACDIALQHAYNETHGRIEQLLKGQG